ncbi:UNVERIFIED_CONTAM: protein REDUCED WALL ACETYLATION 1 [Sesamum radiatum]|uniref:Protein REDUCED WALL ACETYLATION 1 n=1 Tax=Sesamum radiatum TaxID=300843 RepID=A0AAW2UC44_SESRA
MVIYGPLTPGQVAFFLGIVPVFAAWLYSEYLEYRKNSSFSKQSEFGALLVYFYICDRTNLLGESKKVTLTQHQNQISAFA